MKLRIGSAALMLMVAATLTLVAPVPVVALGTTYYVNNQAGSNCSDSGAGTSQTQPWCTFAPIRSHGAFSAGDQILLARGATWNDYMTLSGTGTSTNWITVTAYGSGARPRILHNNNGTVAALAAGATSATYTVVAGSAPVTGDIVRFAGTSPESVVLTGVSGSGPYTISWSGGIDNAHSAGAIAYDQGYVGIRITTPDYWAFSNLELGYWAGAGLLATYQSKLHAGLIVTNVYVHDHFGIFGAIPPTSDGLVASAGILVTANGSFASGSGEYMVTGVTIANVEGAHNQDSVTFENNSVPHSCEDTTPGNNGSHCFTNLTLMYLNLHDNDAEGTGYCSDTLRLDNSNTVKVLDSAFARNAGCYVASGTTNAILQDGQYITLVNDAISNAPNTGSNDQTGVDLEANTDNVAFRGDYFGNNAGPGQETLIYAPGLVGNGYFRANPCSFGWTLTQGSDACLGYGPPPQTHYTGALQVSTGASQGIVDQALANWTAGSTYSISATAQVNAGTANIGLTDKNGYTCWLTFTSTSWTTVQTGPSPNPPNCTIPNPETHTLYFELQSGTSNGNYVNASNLSMSLQSPAASCPPQTNIEVSDGASWNQGWAGTGNYSWTNYGGANYQFTLAACSNLATGTFKSNVYNEPTGFTRTSVSPEPGSWAGVTQTANLNSAAATGHVYNGPADFSCSSNGAAQWSYQQSTNGTTWTNLSSCTQVSSPLDQEWQQAGGGGFVSNFDVYPSSTSTTWMARTWTAPVAGIVSLRGRALQTAPTVSGDPTTCPSGDAVTAEIFQNSSTTPLVGSANDIAAGDGTGVSLDVDGLPVNAGDTLHFALKEGTGAVQCKISWAPSVGYVAAGTNLLSNPSFESGLTGWTAGQGTETLLTSGGGDGGQALQVASTASLQGDRWQTVSGWTAGNTYIIGGFGAVNTGTGYIDVTDGSSFSCLLTVTATSWTYQSNSCTIPAGTTSVSFANVAPTGNGNYINTDGLSMTLSPSNLLSNPGFESGLTGWGGAGTATIMSGGGTSPEGNQSLKVTSTSGQQGDYWQTVAGWAAGKTYVIGGFAAVNTGTGYIDLTDGTSYSCLLTVTATSWTYGATSCAIPAGTANLYFANVAPTGTGNWIETDALSMTLQQ